jgi:hypothetical protein
MQDKNIAGAYIEEYVCKAFKIPATMICKRGYTKAPVIHTEARW